MVPPASNINSLSDLKGKRVRVAGGPLDKSWLLLRAYAQKELGVDFAGEVEPVFGAPPLLNEEPARGRIDAVLTYWHYAARLEASGARVFLSVTDMIRRLGIDSQVPMLGYAFREEWADREGTALQGFIGASRDANALLASSKDEWIRLAPLIGDARSGGAERAPSWISRWYSGSVVRGRAAGGIRSLCYPGQDRRRQACRIGNGPRCEDLLALHIVLRLPMRAAGAERRETWQEIASILLLLSLWQIGAGLADPQADLSDTDLPSCGVGLHPA
jgi:hypothetical protein